MTAGVEVGRSMAGTCCWRGAVDVVMDARVKAAAAARAEGSSREDQRRRGGDRFKWNTLGCDSARIDDSGKDMERQSSWWLARILPRPSSPLLRSPGGRPPRRSWVRSSSDVAAVTEALRRSPDAAPLLEGRTCILERGVAGSNHPDDDRDSIQFLRTICEKKIIFFEDFDVVLVAARFSRSSGTGCLLWAMEAMHMVALEISRQTGS